MNWKMRGLGAAGALVLAGSFAGLPAFGVTAINGTGTVSNCHFSGTVKFNPPLSNTTKVVTTTINTAITCNGGTGDGKRIKSGTATGTEKKSTSCSGLAGTTAHKIYISTKWVVRSGAPLNPSNGQLTSVTSNVSNSGAISFDAKGKVSSGSFHVAPKNDIFAHALVKENASTVLSQCGGSGVSILHLLSTSALKID